MVQRFLESPWVAGGLGALNYSLQGQGEERRRQRALMEKMALNRIDQILSENRARESEKLRREGAEWDANLAERTWKRQNMLQELYGPSDPRADQRADLELSTAKTNDRKAAVTLKHLEDEIKKGEKASEERAAERDRLRAWRQAILGLDMRNYDDREEVRRLATVHRVTHTEPYRNWESQVYNKYLQADARMSPVDRMIMESMGDLVPDAEGAGAGRLMGAGPGAGPGDGQSQMGAPAAGSMSPISGITPAAADATGMGMTSPSLPAMAPGATADTTGLGAFLSPPARPPVTSLAATPPAAVQPGAGVGMGAQPSLADSVDPAVAPYIEPLIQRLISSGKAAGRMEAEAIVREMLLRSGQLQR